MAELIAFDRTQPFIAGGIAGAAAALLLVVAVLWAAGMFAARDNDQAALGARLAPLEAQVRELASRPTPPAVDTKALDSLAVRLGKIESAVSAPRTDPALAARVTGVESATRPLADAIADLSRRMDNVAAAAREAKSSADAAAAAATAAGQKADRAGEGRVARGDIEALGNRIAGLEKSTKSVTDEIARRNAANGGDRVERLAIASEALRAAAERGDPFVAELAAVKTLGGDPKATAALEPYSAIGVPRAGVLAAEISALVPAMLRAARATSRESGVLDKLQASAERLVRIRRIGESAGEDPETVIARIEVKAANGDLSGVLDEVARLPDAARAPAAAWQRKAEARGAALAAARRMAAEAVTGLGKPLPQAGR
jgi:hypothetical protein